MAAPVKDLFITINSVAAAPQIGTNHPLVSEKAGRMQVTFQLVRASDNDIAVWQTEHGHIYGFTACPDTDSLQPRFMRDAPDATEPAQAFADEALRFATIEARSRQIIGGRVKRGRRAGCRTEPA